MSRLMFVVLVTVLAWCPWPLGSNRPWSWFVLMTVLFALLAVWCVRAALRGQPSRLPVGGRSALLAGVAGLAVGVAQMLPVPAWLVQSLAADVAFQQSLAPGNQAVMTLSLDVGATLVETLKLAAYLAVFFLVMVLVDSRRRLSTLLTVLVVIGVAQVLYGTLARYGAAHITLWDPSFDRQTISGTYVNRNHFAGLLVLAIGTCAGATLMSLRDHSAGTGIRAAIDRLTRIALGRGLWLVFALMVLTGGLLLSTSRGAMMAAVAGVAIVAVVTGHGRRLPRIAAGALILVMSAGIWLGTGELLPRMVDKGLASDRPELVARTLDLVERSPWTGGGAGTFGWRFPEVRGENLQNAYFHHAHNDYLELLSDVGVLGAVPFAIGALLVGWRLAAGLRTRHDPLARACLTGTAMALAGALVHALVGFNFHIPANAAWFFALAGAAMVAADRDKLRHDGTGSSGRRRPATHAPFSGDFP